MGAAHQRLRQSPAAAAAVVVGLAPELRPAGVQAAATLGVGCMWVCLRRGPALAGMLRCLGWVCWVVGVGRCSCLRRCHTLLNSHPSTSQRQRTLQPPTHMHRGTGAAVLQQRVCAVPHETVDGTNAARTVMQIVLKEKAWPASC